MDGLDIRGGAEGEGELDGGAGHDGFLVSGLRLEFCRCWLMKICS